MAAIEKKIPSKKCAASLFAAPADSPRRFVDESFRFFLCRLLLRPPFRALFYFTDTELASAALTPENEDVTFFFLVDILKEGTEKAFSSFCHPMLWLSRGFYPVLLGFRKPESKGWILFFFLVETTSLLNVVRSFTAFAGFYCILLTFSRLDWVSAID